MMSRLPDLWPKYPAGRRCRKCRAFLSAYNPWAICRPCERGGREPVPDPDPGPVNYGRHSNGPGAAISHHGWGDTIRGRQD